MQAQHYNTQHPAVLAPHAQCSCEMWILADTVSISRHLNDCHQGWKDHGKLMCPFTQAVCGAVPVPQYAEHLLENHFLRNIVMAEVTQPASPPNKGIWASIDDYDGAPPQHRGSVQQQTPPGITMFFRTAAVDDAASSSSSQRGAVDYPAAYEFLASQGWKSDHNDPQPPANFCMTETVNPADLHAWPGQYWGEQNSL